MRCEKDGSAAGGPGQAKVVGAGVAALVTGDLVALGTEALGMARAWGVDVDTEHLSGALGDECLDLVEAAPVLADAFAELTRQGRLNTPDAALAATQFN